jgi:thiol-disulfide isomerase/thioredoxin
MKFDRARWWIAAAALVALATGVRVWHHFFPQQVLHAGDRLVPMAVSSLAGNGYTLAPDGRPQIIHVFATWCEPCRLEMPAFARTAEVLRAGGVAVIAIDQEEAANTVAAFAREFNLPFPVYIDTRNVTQNILGARMIPTTIFVDGNGVIRWEHPGPMTRHDLSILGELVQQE